MSKRQTREEAFDLFVPRINGLPLKDQWEVMERPFFSLSKRKRQKPIEYTSPDGGGLGQRQRQSEVWHRHHLGRRHPDLGHLADQSDA